MKHLFPCIGLFLLIISSFSSVAQVNVTWRQWPAQKQLYPRDAQNKAEVPVAGQFQSATYSTASLLIYQNGRLWKNVRGATVRNGNQAQFAFNPTIEAGLNEYSFRLYAVAGRDSLLVASRDSILCGDVFLLAGQSNIAVFYPENYSYTNKFLRTFGSYGTESPGDTLWRVSNSMSGQAGLVGTEIQRIILETYQMPTCILNGAMGGTGIWANIARNKNNPTDLSTIYGRLLYRARKAGVADKIKAIAWWQGENEAGGGSAIDYDKGIDTLFANWKADYKNVKKIYVSQLNLLADPNARAGWVRDLQRRMAYLYPNTEAIATVGLPVYDGVHYQHAGYKQFAVELSRLLGRDFYGSTDTTEISSPAIQRAYYLTPDQQEVVLEFDPSAKMVWTQDTALVNNSFNGPGNYILDLRTFLYFDYDVSRQQDRLVDSGRADGNRIVLKLNQKIKAQTITYLPDFFGSSVTPYYNGPVLKNSRGMRALTFYKYPIAAATPPPLNLIAEAISDTQINLNWDQGAAEGNAYSIERSANTPDNFKEIAQVNARTFAYSDRIVPGNSQRFYYRVASVNAKAESPFSNLAEVTPLVLGIEPVSVQNLRVYPIPTRSSLQCDIPEKHQFQKLQVSVVDLTGRTLLRQTMSGGRSINLEVGSVPPGVYSLRLSWEDETLVRKIVIQ
ncbi:sialate O-acetylesterase [Tellurirhabdus bombi]|uniref:sialate O-acetylesterase n=1 Tax=Tellurirhabdus bombi TaxID=2907205 RepID=UPI001F45414A|nr:sialate O-acetylesterase [Tellurirhabdus bombi]